MFRMSKCSVFLSGMRPVFCMSPHLNIICTIQRVHAKLKIPIQGWRWVTAHNSIRIHSRSSLWTFVGGANLKCLIHAIRTISSHFRSWSEVSFVVSWLSEHRHVTEHTSDNPKIENRSKIGDFALTRSVWRKISDSRACDFTPKRPFCIFEPHFWGLCATYDDHLRLIWKRVVDFLLVLRLDVTDEALWANIGSKSAISLQRGRLTQNFR